MKKFNFFLLLLGVVLSGCSAYQYSARQTNVARRSINTYEQMASIDVDYSKQVTATSNFHQTKKTAINEAEFLCIQENNIDVIVDPIYKVKRRPTGIRKYQAVVVGFAGMYKVEPTAIDKSKQYTMEEVEKYKLLTDPVFPKYYYHNGMQGDCYYFGTQSPDVRPTSTTIQSNVFNTTTQIKKVGGLKGLIQRIKAKRQGGADNSDF